MGSNVLPQSLFMIPRNPTECRPKALGFSALVSRHPSSFNSTRVSTNAFGAGFHPVIAKLSDKRFLVRAESSSEGEAEVEATENGEESEAVASEAEGEVESEVTAEAEAEAKPPRKPRVKLGDIMGILNKRAVEASQEIRPIPDIRTGDVVEIKLEVPENRRRLSVYKGIVMSKQNAGIHTTIRIRRIIAGIGVEIVFPV